MSARRGGEGVPRASGAAARPLLKLRGARALLPFVALCEIAAHNCTFPGQESSPVEERGLRDRPARRPHLRPEPAVPPPGARPSPPRVLRALLAAGAGSGPARAAPLPAIALLGIYPKDMKEDLPQNEQL
ncbi:uncharacterized protein LOC144229551 [Crocuta crocuta]